jgi:hypothetical protein
MRLAQVVRNGHNNLPLHGYGKGGQKCDSSRLLRQLMQWNVLREDTFRMENAYGNISTAIKVIGPLLVSVFLSGRGLCNLGAAAAADLRWFL